MRANTRRWATVVSLAMAGLSAPVFVFAAGTEGKPAASAAAKAADAPAASSSAGKPADKPDGGAPQDGGPGPVDGSALPPGHPQMDEDLPEGHPQMGGDPHANPHAGAQPRGQRGDFFEPPEDVSVDDPSIAPGTLVLSIRDADDKPIPKASVVLSILESSVAKGDSRKRRTIETDGEGTAQVDGLTIGGGTSYRVSTTRDGGSFVSDPFVLSAKAGKRVVVHAYESTANVENVLVGIQAFVFVSLREDALSVEHSFRIFNIGKTAWVPDLEGAKMLMPETQKAFNAADAMADLKFVEGKSHDASLVGTITPGQHEASFRYHVPLQGSERQTFHITLPPRVGEVRVFSESGKTLGLDVAGFPTAQKQRGNDGRRVWITARQASPGEHGVRTLDITITGLPTPGPGRWIAVFGAIAALGLMGVYLVKQRDPSTAEDIRGDLQEARDALLGEFVVLEKAHRKGDIGPKTYQRLRIALLDALARIEGRLDEVRTARAERRRQDRAARGGAS